MSDSIRQTAEFYVEKYRRRRDILGRPEALTPAALAEIVQPGPVPPEIETAIIQAFDLLVLAGDLSDDQPQDQQAADARLSAIRARVDDLPPATVAQRPDPGREDAD